MVEDIVSYRFLINFVLIFVTIIIFTFIFMSHYQNMQESYSKNTIENNKNLMMSSRELVKLLSTPQRLVMRPGASRFISDGYEDRIPQGLLFQMEEIKLYRKEGCPDSSPFYPTDLTFVAQFLLSFFAIILSFNAITGEKEKGTLRLVFSNSIKKSYLVFTKYLSAFLTVAFSFLLGIIFSLILLNLSHAVPLSSALVFSLFLFFIASLFYVSIFILIGLLCSTFSHNSKNSLVLCLLLWIFLVVILPKSAGLFLNLEKFDVPNEKNIEELADQASREVWNRYRSMYSPEEYFVGGGTDESTKLNAKIGLEADNAKQEVFDNYLRKKLQAVSTLMKINFISPASLFEYAASSLAGTGIFHFQNLWRQVRQYQNDFVDFFKRQDMKDEESYHIFFHPDFLSKKPVDFNKIPRFEEMAVKAGERIKESARYILILALYNLMLFILVFYKFSRYDVR